VAGRVEIAELYLASFRDHGAFHEACTIAVGKKLVALLRPKWLRIGGYWYPRGGMPIDVFWQSGKLPAGVWVPDQGVAPYRGAGRGSVSIAQSPSASWPGLLYGPATYAFLCAASKTWVLGTRPGMTTEGP